MQPRRKGVSVGLTAIDLFSGAGGLSLGLAQAGYEVLFANDVDEAAASTYRTVFPETEFVEGSVADISARQVLRRTGLRKGELDLLIGGPPCQGFSIIGPRNVGDPRNGLFREFLRLAEGLAPRAIVIENVPGIATLRDGAVMRAILGSFRKLGYSASCAELLAAQYGVPQMRWRMFFVGFRRGERAGAGTGIPAPTCGNTGIGELVPNCTISNRQMAGFLTTRDAIGDLPPVGPGEEGQVYSGKPSTAYQRMMRGSLGSALFNHYAPRLGANNLARITALRPGQDWRDLPRDLLPAGMLRAKRKDHTRRYSRMEWSGVPRAIITRFRDPKSGEYTHPSQHRTITIREAARIQSFPDSFRFLGTNSEIYDQVGNAVPPRLARAVAEEVAACLAGEPRHTLANPFPRRRSYLQARLEFDAG